MDIAQLTEVVGEFNYLLARISKYLKNNQYVYQRAFSSWLESYSQAAERLNADQTLRIPSFKLSPIDYSASGKSINKASVEKFVKTISHQIIRLEDKIEELNKAAEQSFIPTHPLEKFFHRDVHGNSIEPPQAKKRVFVAIPAGEDSQQLFWRGIQPALETQGLSFFRADRPLLDDAALCELAQELHSCRLAILDISGQAASVMLALGLAYGIDKPAIILQQQDEPRLGEINNTAYLPYTGAAEIKATLSAMLPQLLND